MEPRSPSRTWRITLLSVSSYTYVITARIREGYKRSGTRSGRYSLAPLIHWRMVTYSGESFVQRTPPPCANVLEPAIPSVSALDVGLRRSRLFSGSDVSTTFITVDQLALNSVW